MALAGALVVAAALAAPEPFATPAAVVTCGAVVAVGAAGGCVVAGAVCRLAAPCWAVACFPVEQSLAVAPLAATPEAPRARWARRRHVKQMEPPAAGEYLPIGHA